MPLSFGMFCYLTVHARRFSHAQLFTTLKDCSPTGSPVHGDSPGKNTGVSCHALLQGIFLTQGSNSYISCTGRCVLYREHQLGIK